MENFIFQNPVKLIMGKGMIARLAKEIPSDKRIMITFGGGSVKKNGVYDQVKEALKDHFTVEFWGIEPNPAIETLRKAIALGKEEKVDYLLAVGGGFGQTLHEHGQGFFHGVLRHDHLLLGIELQTREVL